MPELLAAVLGGGHGEAVGVGGRSITYGRLRDAASAVAAHLSRGEHVAVWAEPTLETCVGVVGALIGDAVAVPVNPRIGSKELAHVLRVAAPERVLAAPGDELPVRWERCSASTWSSMHRAGRSRPSPPPMHRRWCSSPRARRGRRRAR